MDARRSAVYTFGSMPSARETFLAHVTDPQAPSTVAELRRALTAAKLEALTQVERVGEEGVRQIMPDLYEHIVTTQIQLAGHVGLGTCMALVAFDEHESSASLSRFNREIRQQMTDIGVGLKRRRTSQLAHAIAEIEAQRLAWRHGHEFLSWLAFRRDDERYPADDRRARLDAFKVAERLLQTRDVVVGMLGAWLTGAIEGCDRFLLGNRWRLAASPEHAIETHVWPVLSLQPSPTVKVEQARYEVDLAIEGGAPAETIATLKGRATTLFLAQLEQSLDNLPPSAEAGTF